MPLMLYVPTIKRIDHQFTLRALNKKWLGRTTLVCAQGEEKKHAKNFPGLLRIVAPPTKNICETRAWIFKHAHRKGYDKIMMMDDDLVFSLREKGPVSLRGVHSDKADEEWARIKKKHPEYARLTTLQPGDDRVGIIMRNIEMILDKYRHAGISERYFNNLKGPEWIANTKLLHALAFHVPTVMAHCELGWTKWYEDVDYTVQLLRAGYENALLCWAAVNEGRGWNAPGGCSSYRTEEDSKPYAYALANKYPGIVRVWEKKDKVTGEIQYRHVINWKKAISQGRASNFIK